MEAQLSTYRVIAAGEYFEGTLVLGEVETTGRIEPEHAMALVVPFVNSQGAITAGLIVCCVDAADEGKHPEDAALFGGIVSWDGGNPSIQFFDPRPPR